MSSTFSPDLEENDENESSIEPTKPKRLPRSAKKRLRYERIRQQRKLARKNKKTSISINQPALSLSSTTTIENSSEEVKSKLGKIVKRAANERLAEINQDLTATVICIDCSYNDSMTGKEMASLARQIGRCYSSNRRATKPVRFILANWSNENSLAQECRRVNSGFDNYQIILNEKSVNESFPSERLIYLSPNADKILNEFDEQTIFIIGGLVDDSVRKNVTYRACQDRNMTCYKLPIETYMKHSIDGGTFNQILTINQVFDILLTYISDKDWGEALKKNIPERKGWVIKQTSS